MTYPPIKVSLRAAERRICEPPSAADPNAWAEQFRFLFAGERAGRRMINHVLSEPARRCRDQHGGNPGIDQRPQHVQYAIRPRHPLELLLGDVIDHRLGALVAHDERLCARQPARRAGLKRA